MLASLGPAVYVGTSLYLRGSRRLGGDDDDGGDDGMSFEIDSGNKGFDAFFLWFFIAVLVSLSALFSGLTLGLLGLDKNGLDIARRPAPGARPAGRPRALLRARARFPALRSRTAGRRRTASTRSSSSPCATTGTGSCARCSWATSP